MATLITNVTELQAMNDDLAGDYELANDIDAVLTSGWNAGAGFVPIGVFTGSLDGKGYTISDLYINRADSYQALFSYANGATLQNINLSVSITGRSYLAALAAWVWGGATVTNCHSSGTIDATGLGAGQVGGLICEAFAATISNSSSSCTITAGSNNTGGFAYNIDGAVVEDCHATGNVTSHGFAAGFATFIDTGSEVRRCYATGNILSTRIFAGGFACEILGGLVEQCYATGSVQGDDSEVAGFSVGIYYGAIVRNCYARGNVTAVASEVGGFAGLMWTNAATPLVEHCYSTGAVVGVGAEVGGFIGVRYHGIITNSFWDTQTSGQATSAGGTGKTTAEMKLLATFGAWNISASTTDLNNGYPYLGWQLGSSPTWYIYEAAVSPVNTDVYIVALEALRNIEMSAMGRVYVDESGNLCYENRYARQL